MEATISLNSVYRPSENVVAREIEGEIIIVPLAAGIGDMEDELFTLNETGRLIWGRLDGKKQVRELAVDHAKEHDSSEEEIRKDVVGFLSELLKRRIIVQVGG